MNPLWLVDRSRIEDGRSTCPRSRLLGYHIGPDGYGIQMKATKLPLMTGIAGHAGMAPILEWCRDHDELIQHGMGLPQEKGEVYLPIPREVIRAAVAGAQQDYARVVALRGFAYLAPTEEGQQVVREQNYLIEGLIWAWCLEVLPEVLRRGKVIEVEHDDTYVVGCSCGLGEGIGTKLDHEERECQGIGLMCRPDFLLETRETREIEYHEFKTTGMDSITFRDKWEVMMQLFAATLDAERRWGRQVQSIYIHGLIKGKRQGDYNPETGKYDGGGIKQQSIFCYGFRKPANPPMEQEQWAAQYDYVDEDGKNRRLGKLWRKAGVWELPESYIPAGMSKGEHWATWMPPEVRKKNLVLIGPLSRQTLMVEHFLEEVRGEEGRWQAALWEIYDLGATLLHEAYGPELPEGPAGALWWEIVWPDARFQSLLDRLVPRSYACRRYGGRNKCQFEGPCLYHEGWANPVGSGLFIARTPHHRDEGDQMRARGLHPPALGTAEDLEWDAS